LTSGGVSEATVASDTNLTVLVPVSFNCLVLGAVIEFFVKKFVGRVGARTKELHEPLELDPVELLPPPT
jgi:hypothetical protein